MKKYILTVLLTVLVMFAFSTSVYATEVNVENNEKMDSSIAKIIDFQLSREEKEMLKGVEELNDEPVLKIYESTYWELAGETSREMIAGAEEYSTTKNFGTYYAFSNVPYIILTFNDKVTIKNFNEIPQYVKDISTMSSQVTINGENLDVRGIYCFDGDTSHSGIIVCILTEGESLVKYYENSHSKALLFSETEFREYASDYYAYISSYEYNHNEYGEFVGGVTVSFKEFIEGRELGNGVNDMNTNLFLAKLNYQYLGLGLCLLLGAVSIMIGCVICRKNKKM